MEHDVFSIEMCELFENKSNRISDIQSDSDLINLNTGRFITGKQYLITYLEYQKCE